jgi:hypothetical protein
VSTLPSKLLGVAPETLQVVISPCFLGKNVDHQVAIIHQHPLRVPIAFDAGGIVAELLELQLDLVRDGLNLASIAASADDEVVGEGADLSDIQRDDVTGLLRVSGSDGCEPRWFRWV